MPNTVVKLTNAESPWLEAAREDRKLLIKKEALTVMVSAFLLCVSFEVMGFWDGIGGKLYSRRLTPFGRGLMAPPGLTALGAKGSVRVRLTPPGRVECSAQGSYIVSLRWRGGRPYGRQYKCRLWRRKPSQPGFRPWKNHTTALRAWEMLFPFGGWRHHLSPAVRGHYVC